MHLDHTPEQLRLRIELRAYFAELVPDNAYARHTDPVAANLPGGSVSALAA